MGPPLRSRGSQEKGGRHRFLIPDRASLNSSLFHRWCEGQNPNPIFPSSPFQSLNRLLKSYLHIHESLQFLLKRIHSFLKGAAWFNVKLSLFSSGERPLFFFTHLFKLTKKD